MIDLILTKAIYFNYKTMLTVPKLAHQPQLSKTITAPPSYSGNSSLDLSTSINMFVMEKPPKLPSQSTSTFRGKQNLPISKTDVTFVHSSSTKNITHSHNHQQPCQKLINRKLIPDNNQKWVQNKSPSKSNKIQKGITQFFSPVYLKEREENQKILQSLKLENENYKKLIEESQFIRKRTNTNEITPFDFLVQSENYSSNTQSMKKSPLKEFFFNPRKALEEMTNLTTSFIFDEGQSLTNSICMNSFQSDNTLEDKEINSSSIKHQVSDFEKLKFLGKGNFGEVNLVRHKKTNFICAMKTIKKSFAKQENVMHQISREIRIHLSLKHLNIIAFYGFFDDNESVYLLIEYATGGELYKKLKQSYRMPQSQVIPIIRNALDGLKLIHSLGYIHRDLKPENMIFQFGIGKICDLGWAADCGFNEMRKSYCGTPLYLPPEMIRKEEYDKSADIWSIGILTYELIVGKIPFNIWSEYDLQQIVQKEISFPTDYVDMSKDSMDFIKKCLNKDPLKRIKLEQLINHPFMKVSQNQGYFNVEVYDWVQKLFE